jgi:hypothetical protein
MASDNLVYSDQVLNELITSGEDESKLIFDNPNSELSLAYFLLLRKAFNDAYDRIKQQVTEAGTSQIGEHFRGLAGGYVRGSYSERGGSKYTVDAGLEMEVGAELSELVATFMVDKHPEIDPDFIEVGISFKVNTKNVDAHIKKERELPMFIQNAERSKSLSLTVLKSAKEELQANADALLGVAPSVLVISEDSEHTGQEVQGE